MVCSILEELLKQKSQSNGNGKGRRKFSKREYENLARKAEIFGKRANVVRTTKDGRYDDIYLWCLIFHAFEEERLLRQW